MNSLKDIIKNLYNINEYEISIHNSTTTNISFYVGNNKTVLHLKGNDILNTIKWFSIVDSQITDAVGIDADKYKDVQCKMIINTGNTLLEIVGYSLSGKYIVVRDILK